MKAKRRKLAGLIALGLTLNLSCSYIVSATDKIYMKNSNGIEKVEVNNLVINHSFENVDIDGKPSNWKLWNGGQESAGIDEENAYEGNRCAYIVQNSSLGHVLTNLKPYTTYKYTAYVKLKNTDDSAVLGVKDYGGVEIKEKVIGNEYEKNTITFTTGNQTTAEVYLWDGSGLSNGGRAYIDKVSVEEQPYEGDLEVKLNVSELLLSEEEEYELTTKILPSNALNKNINYTSSDVSIATVDENGKIKAIKEGQAIITATPEAGGTESTCIVNVTENKQPWYPDTNGSEWSLVMEDEFSGDTLDTSKWTIRGKEYKTYHRSDMVSVEDGKLKLGIEKEPDGQVVLGRIDNHVEDLTSNETKFSQKYGFFEASAKIPPTEQTYFAFWMFNYPGVFNVDGTGREGLEIDITETVFQGDYTESTLHWDGYDRGHKSTSSHAKKAPNIHDGFHRYGLEWTEDTLKFYFDGKLTWTYSGEAVPWVKEILIFSSGLGMWGQGNINNAKLPYTAEVDWVRVYDRENNKEDDKEDDKKPLLYGLDDLKISVNGCENLLEGVWAVDNKDDEDDLTKLIKLDESKIDRSTPGEYIATYEVTDAAGNTKVEEREVHVVSGEALTNRVFNGTFEKDYLYKWSVDGKEGEAIDYTKAGVVTDNQSGNYAYIEPKASMEQFISLKPNTTYRLKVKAKPENPNETVEIGVEMYGGDKKKVLISGSEWKEDTFMFTTDVEHTNGMVYAYNGNEKGKVFIEEFVVIEEENPDKEAPTITGINDIKIKKGSKFDPKEGVQVLDNKDGDLTVWLDVKGKVDIEKSGVYILTYEVKDEALNLTKKTRKIEVYEEEEVLPIENPNKPKNLLDEEVTADSIALSWEAPSNIEIKEYIIYKDGIEVAKIDGKFNSFKVEELNSNTLYGFKLVAKGINDKISRPISKNIRTLKN